MQPLPRCATQRALQDALGTSSSESDTGVDVVTAGENDALTDLADALKDLPHGKIVAPLLKTGRKAIPRDDFLIRARLLPDGAGGKGLTLALETRRAHVRDTVTLWENTYRASMGNDKAKTGTALTRLAIAAAAWTEFAIFRHRRDDRRLRPLFGTDDWESYAYFKVGLYCRTAGLADDAEVLFARAASRDVDNASALINLAVLEAHKERLGLALERLNRAEVRARLTVPADLVEVDNKRRAVVDRLDDYATRDPRWFVAVYNQAVVHLTDGPGKPPDLDKALSKAKQLVFAIERGLSALEALDRLEDDGGVAAALVRLRLTILRRCQGPALVLLAGVLVEQSLHGPRSTEGDLTRNDLIEHVEATPYNAP